MNIKHNYISTNNTISGNNLPKACACFQFKHHSGYNWNHEQQAMLLWFRYFSCPVLE